MVCWASAAASSADRARGLSPKLTNDTVTNVTIQDLRLSARVLNVLRRRKIDGIEQLLTCSRRDLLCSRYLGHTTLYDLEAELARHGLHLRDDEAPKRDFDELAGQIGAIKRRIVLLAEDLAAVEDMIGSLRRIGIRRAAGAPPSALIQSYPPKLLKTIEGQRIAAELWAEECLSQDEIANLFSTTNGSVSLAIKGFLTHHVGQHALKHCCLEDRRQMVRDVLGRLRNGISDPGEHGVLTSPAIYPVPKFHSAR